MTTARFKTRFIKQLRSRGTTVAQWSRDHGFSPVSVSHVLNGQNKAMYGTGFQIAIALGIKQKPADDASDQLHPKAQIPTQESDARLSGAGGTAS